MLLIMICNYMCCIGCGEDWEPIGDNCYVYRPRKMTWHEAEADCVNGGGHLASIHSDEENDDVMAYVKYVNTCVIVQIILLTRT